MNNENEQNDVESRETAGPVGATVDADEVQRQRDDYYDRLLRKTAEFENYRKRVDRDRQSMAESATADLVRDLLPLVDDLERALKADASAASSSFTGSCSRFCESAVCAPSRRSERTLIRISTRPWPTRPPKAGGREK
jgi:molecular chaperone GrpE (heat shock protein)